MKKFDMKKFDMKKFDMKKFDMKKTYISKVESLIALSSRCDIISNWKSDIFLSEKNRNT